MSFERAGTLSELLPGQIVGVSVKGRAVVLCNVEGTVYALDDMCTHARVRLSGGTLEGTELECPRHGGRFDARTGQATCLPAAAPVATYPVKVEGTDILVDVQ